MELFATIIVAVFVLAARLGRHIVRRHPDSPSGTVLRNVDQQTLTAGIVFGVAIVFVTTFTQTFAPPLAWTWIDGVGDPGSTVSAAELPLMVLLVVGLGAAFVFPPFMVAVMPALMLSWGAWLAHRRHRLHCPLSPLQTFLVASATTMVIGCPVIGSICYGAATAVTSVLVRAQPIQDRPGVPVGHGHDLVQSWVEQRYGGPRNWRYYGALDKQWGQLSPTSRYEVARVCAIHVITIMAWYATSMLTWIAASLS